MRNLVSGLAVLVFVTVTPGSAQEVNKSAAGLQNVNPGTTLFVTDRHGAEIRGTFQRAGATTLIMSVGGTTREMPLPEVLVVEKPAPVATGALLGAVPMAFLFSASAGASCSPSCGTVVPLVGLGGALLGGWLGAKIARGHAGRSVIYRASPNPPDAGGTSISIADLTSRLDINDAIDVREAGGRMQSGRFRGASPTSLLLSVDGEVRTIPAGDVALVRREGHRTWTGALIGAAVGVTGPLYSDECRRQFGECLWSGAALGAVIGRFIPTYRVVYGAQPTVAVQLVPMFSGHRSGLGISVRF